MTSRLRVISDSANGMIQCSPAVSGSESSIAFYRNTLRSISATGDVWVVGHNAHGSGDRGFAIGTNNLGPALSINTAGLVTIPNGLTVNGPIISTTGEIRPWVLGRINTGATGFTNLNGARGAADGVTAVRVNDAQGNPIPGRYAISWPSVGMSTSYVQLTCSATVGTQRFVNYTLLTATGMIVHCYDQTGAPQATDINVRVDVAG